MADTAQTGPQFDTLELDPADGQQYIEELRDKLFELLKTCETKEDTEDRLRKLYPESKLIDLAIGDTRSRSETLKLQKHRHHSSSSGGASFSSFSLQTLTTFAVAKVAKVRDGVVGNRAENEAAKFKTAIIEYIIDDVLSLAGDFVRRQKGNFIITRSDIRTAMHADKDLLDMFLSDDKSLLITENHPILALVNSINGDKSNHLYPHYSHSHLHPTLPHQHHNHNHNLSTMTYRQKVRNMVDSENSFNRGLKLIIKVFKAQLEKLPDIKREVEILFCNIDELLELSTLLLTAFEDALESVGQEGEVPYVGSDIFELAQAEEFQAFFNFAFRRLYRDEPWRAAYLRIVTNEATMTAIRTGGNSFDLAVKHLLPNYLLNTIIQFFEYFKNFNDLYELSRRHDNRDDELSLKETVSILIKTKRAIEEILESELDPKEIQTIDPKQAEDIRVILERRLDAELQHERNLPLPYMPPTDIYRFSEPDSKDNIQFEDYQNHRTISSRDFDKQIRSDSDHIPVIRCATLLKLVERLTYHKYQPNIVDSFLITYRAFISDPQELLDLLIERFKIPDPPLYVVFSNFVGSPDDLSEADRTAYRHYLKRFRQEYSKPVKMRVINVLKSWIKNHYYDFERHPTLLENLDKFLNEVIQTDKVLQSLINSIKKSIEQKKTSQKDDFEFIFSESQKPPEIEWLSNGAKANEPEKFDLLSLHPREFARQLTLIEFDLFRAIKPSELINVRDLGMRAKRDEKNETSPNLSRMTRHFTLLSYWIRKCIVEVEDFDKRSEVYKRVVDIMKHLRDYNNFTGLLCIGSAMESAPIGRLGHTRKTLTRNLVDVMNDYNELIRNHQKKLQEDLKSCNPPCIPYLGSYQTKLIHAKEGNRTFMDEVDTTISPTLSNDEFNSSFSNSPATPISPRTPLPTRQPLHSATSIVSNQFFGGCTLPRSLTHNYSTEMSPNSLNNFEAFSGANNNTMPHFYTFNQNQAADCGSINGSHVLSSSFSASNHSHLMQQMQQPQPPLPMTPHQLPFTPPAPPKMINFTKQRIRAGLVAEISNYQNTPYCLKVQPEIRRYIESIESQIIAFVASLNRVEDSSNNNNNCKQVMRLKSLEDDVPAMTRKLDDYLYELSERIEPKNSKPPRHGSRRLA